MHGNDPNWGRIVSAAGLAGVPFDPDRATLTLQGTVVFRNGQPVPFDAAKVSESLKAAGGDGGAVLPAGQGGGDRLDVRSVEGVRDDQRGLSHLSRAV